MAIDGEYAGLIAARADLIAACVAHLESITPEMRAYSRAQRDATVADLGHIVDTPRASVYIDDPELFGGLPRLAG